jgi:Zn-dependent protease
VSDHDEDDKTIERNDPATPAEMVTVAVFLSIVLGLFVVEVVRDYQPIKLTIFFLAGSWMLLMVLHELGHAITASLLGWQVGAIVLGMGRTMSIFRLGQTIVELRMFPIEGFVTSVPRNLQRPRTKSALIYFAGPAVDLLVAVGVLLWLGPSTLFTRSEEIDVLLWQSLALAATFQGVLNLIPHSVSTPEGAIANDGMGIIWSFTHPHSYYTEMMRHRWNPEKGEWERTDSAESQHVEG